MIVKTLSKCIREYKKESILTPVYMAGEVFMEVAITYVLSLLIDRGITPGNMGEILRIGGLLILCALVSLAFGVMSGRSAAVASTGFAKNVRQDMYYNIQTFSFANIDKFSTASLITRLTTDVTRMQHAYMMLIRIAIRSPLMLIFSLIMSFRINARIATVFLCTVPVLGLGIYIMMSKAHPIYERVFKTYDELNRVVQENLRGIRVVKAFVREDHEREKFGKVSDTIYRDFSRAEKITTFGSPLMQASVYTCILLSSWLGAHIIVAGSMTTGQLMSVLTYAMSILSSLMMLSMVLMMLIISRASAERICEVLNERTDIANAPGAETVIPDGSVDFGKIARMSPGASGAELANIVNEAALRAVRAGRTEATEADMEESIEVVIAGYQKKNAILTEQERRTVAYHEIGHAIVAAEQSGSAPVEKITIIPRTSGALGYTMQVEEADRYIVTREELENKIATLTGGRAAEETAFGTMSTGAANDIEQATKLARAMVARYGMSDSFGMVALETEGARYLGGESYAQCSPETQTEIDRQVSEIVKTQHDKALKILSERRAKLDELAQYLYEKETITGEEFMKILKG